MDGNSFVMYRSYFNTYETIKKKRPEDAQAFIDAILTYGFTGETPDEDSIVWLYGIETIFAQIEASSNRYDRAKNSNGGRPGLDITAEQIYQLMETHKTWKSIATELHIEEDTLRKLRNQFGITEKSPAHYRKTEKLSQEENRKTEEEKPKNRKTEKPTEKPKAEKPTEPKNLNDNVNSNFNSNFNFNNYTATREELDLSIAELNKFWYSENIEYAIRDKKVINLGTGEVVHYMTEESFNRWQEHLKNS